MIENKEMLLYSMNKAYEELYNTMSGREINEKEVYFRLGTCLHWIVDCYDRVKELEMSESERKFFQAVKAANNAQKHIKELWKLHKVSNGGYPKKYPRHYGIKYLWEDIKDVPLKHENEKKAYTDLFLGENILKTLEEAKKIIERYYKGCE